MTFDVEPIADMLRCLGRMTGMSLLVWTADDDFVFATDAAPPGEELAAELRDLANRATSTDALVHAEIDGARRICGVSLGGLADEACCLIAITEAAAEADARSRMSNAKALLADMLQLVDAQLSLYGDAEKLTEELSVSYEDLYLFSRIATQIKTLRFSGQMLRSVVSELLDSMRSDLAAAVFPDRPELSVNAANKACADHVDDRQAFIDGLVAAMPAHAPAFDEHCYIVNNSRAISAFRDLVPDAPYRAIAVKVAHDDSVYGWLLLASFEMNEIFRRGEYRLLRSMAEQIGLVLANSDLYRDLEVFVMNMVKALVQAMEAKDANTRGHSDRVSRLSMLIGDGLALDEKQKHDLHWASMLHDIGEIGIPDQVLLKPGPLTADERVLVETHATKGAQILGPVSQLAAAVPGVRSHHERYDGGGYPDGLAGQEIPLLARIIAVADTYDAITSPRTHRPGRSPAEAMAEIRRVAGSQLDPKLVDVFEALMTSEAGVEDDAHDGK